MSEAPFRPIADSVYFPMLFAGNDQPAGTLMGCDHLAFLAPLDTATSHATAALPGLEWHLFGDTRWPSGSNWVEFAMSRAEFHGRCGVLVLFSQIPADEPDPLGWAARNVPLQQIFPSERSSTSIDKRLHLLRRQASLGDDVPGPADSSPRSVQCYCIFRCKTHAVAELTGVYTDLLNGAGVPIQRFRVAEFDESAVGFCRLALNALFHLNKARLTGAKFIEERQLQSFAPAYLAPGRVAPKWAQFHPSRVLRTRPALRAIPSPTELMEGAINFDVLQTVLQTAVKEANAHMLPFERLVRPADPHLVQSDLKIRMDVFGHRANGGAIYVLPDPLVEEFNNTDCQEVQIGDIEFPFPNLFLRFTPPEPVLLAEHARVDGCYIVRQGDECLLILTSCLDSVDYERSLSIACVDPTFSLRLPTGDAQMCVNDAVEYGINAFLKDNAAPADDWSEIFTAPDGTQTQAIDVRATSRTIRIQEFRSQENAFRSCLNIIVNAACFIAFRPEDIEDEWEGDPPSEVLEAAEDPGNTRSKRDKKREAERKLERGDYTRIKICGQNLFSERTETTFEDKGRSPRAHWRRGHWRRQRHGTGLALFILRWIRPTVVMKDSGPVVEARIYDVPTSSEA